MGLMRLGVSNPSANTDVAIYTATGPFLASIIATNKSASVTSNVRMWIVPSGATLTSQYAYLAFDQDIVPQNSLETHRFALNQNDVVYVRADTADMSFMINGLKQVDIALAAGVTSYSNTPPLDVMDGMIWVDKDGNGSALNTLAGQVIQANATTQVPLTVRGIASQTADIFDVQNSAGTDLFSVNKDGVVRMPLQPAFFVLVNAGFSTGTAWTKIPFSSGSGLSTRPSNSVIDLVNNRFTAQVAGWYHFSAGVNFETTNNDTDGFFGISVNGSPGGTRHFGVNQPETGTFDSKSASGSIYLAAGDYAEMYVYTTVVKTTRVTPWAGYFTGYLIG